MARPSYISLSAGLTVLPSVLLAALLVAPLALTGCNLTGAGESPPRGKLYYPTGVAVSADQNFLFVINSNFDRRYSSGSVQSYDLAALDTLIGERCAGDKSGIDCELAPGDVLRSEVLIGSLARAAELSADGSRLYVPTHAESALSYVEVGSSGKLSCGGRRTCSDSFVSDGIPSDPVALRSVPLAALGSASAGDAVLIAHRSGEVSLLVHEAGKKEAPALVHVLDGLSGNVTGLDFDPNSGLFHVSSTTNNTSGLKYLQRVGIDMPDDPMDAYGFAAGATSLRGIGPGQDTWAVHFGAVADTDAALVVAQRPDALLQISIAADGLTADVRNLVEVGGGASRMTITTISGPNGDRTLAIVSCYAERRLFIVDVNSGDVVSIVPGFSGPFELAVDASRARVFVADFDSSTVRILDLAPILERKSARVVATLGQPQFLEELQ